MVNNLKKKILEYIALNFNERNINYAVIHGLEEYPHNLGRDLDILIDYKQKYDALKIISDVSKKENWEIKIFKKRWSWWIIGVKIINNKVIYYELDLIFYLNWAICFLYKKPNPLYYIGPFKIDPWASFSKRIFIKILSNNIDNLKDKQKDLIIKRSEIFIIKNKLKYFIGNKYAEQLILLLLKNNLSKINYILPNIKKQILLRAIIKSPISSLKAFYLWVINELSLTISSKKVAPIIAFVGPDGVGKSTIIKQLKNNLKNESPFTEIIIKHWRPGVLPSLNSFFINKKIKNKSSKPRRSAGKFSIIRFIYYYFDFILGYIILDKPSSSQLKLIIYDRCFLDMLIDPLRYGLKSNKYYEYVYKLLPKVDIIFLLKANINTVHSRKKELKIDEIKIQFKKWEKYILKGYVHYVISTDKKIEETINIIKKNIYIKLIKN